MTPDRTDIHHTVAARWTDPGEGNRYAARRWGSTRRRERDPRRITALLRRLDRPPASVLDVPCGAGRLLPALALLAPRVVGADVSESMLREARRATAADVVRADALRLPFADRAFEVVSCCRLLHHLADPALRRAAVAELVRVARGHVVLTYWDAASWTAWRRRAPGPLRRRVTDARVAIEASALDADLDAAGARVIGRAWSARYLSAQAYVLAEVAPGTGPRR